MKQRMYVVAVAMLMATSCASGLFQQLRSAKALYTRDEAAGTAALQEVYQAAQDANNLSIASSARSFLEQRGLPLRAAMRAAPVEPVVTPEPVAMPVVPAASVVAPAPEPVVTTGMPAIPATPVVMAPPVKKPAAPAKKAPVIDYKKVIDGWNQAFVARNIASSNPVFGRVQAVLNNLPKRPSKQVWDGLKKDVTALIKATPVVAAKPVLKKVSPTAQKQQAQVVGWEKTAAAKTPPVMFAADILTNFATVKGGTALAAKDWAALVAKVNAVLAAKPSEGKAKAPAMTGAQQAQKLRASLTSLNKATKPADAVKAAIVADINALLKSMALPAKMVKGKSVAQYKVAPQAQVDALLARAAAWVKSGAGMGTAAKLSPVVADPAIATMDKAALDQYYLGYLTAGKGTKNPQYIANAQAFIARANIVLPSLQPAAQKGLNNKIKTVTGWIA